MCTPISIKVALGIVLWSLKAIVYWSLKQSIALYSVFQCPNPKTTFIEIGVYFSCVTMPLHMKSWHG